MRFENFMRKTSSSFPETDRFWETKTTITERDGKSPSIILWPFLAFLSVVKEIVSFVWACRFCQISPETRQRRHISPETRQRRQISPELVNVKNLRFGEFELWRNRRKDKDALGLIIQGYNSILPIKILMVKLTKV